MIVQNDTDKSTRMHSILSGLEVDTRHFPPGSFVECVALSGRKHSERYTLPSTPAGLRDLAKTLDIVADFPVSLYIRTNPVKGMLERGHGGFARDADVIEDITTLIDIDPEKDDDGSTPEAHIRHAALIADGIETFVRELFEDDYNPVEPVVVNSGRGYQIRLHHADLGDDGSELKQTLLHALNFRFGCPGAVIVDPCTHDRPRLMRLIGSENRRTGAAATLVASGLGVMSREQYDRLIEAATDGLDNDEMRHRIAEERRNATTAAKRDLMAGRTSCRVVTLPKVSDDETKLLRLTAQERSLIDAIRAAGVPRGRQHYTRMFLSGALLDRGVPAERAEIIIWLGLADIGNRQARKDSAGALRTTARRIDRGDAYASIGTLELEIGGAPFRAIEDALDSMDLVAECIEASEASEENKTDEANEASKAKAPENRTPRDAEYLGRTEGAEFCIAKLGIRHVEGLELDDAIELIARAGKEDERRARRVLRDSIWAWAGGEDRIRAVNQLGEAAGVERWSVVRELDIHHSVSSRSADWIRAIRVDPATETFRTDAGARKLARLSRCGAFCREHVLAESGETIRRVGYSCELYECLFCGSYVWDAGRYYSGRWPASVLVVRFQASDDKPTSCANLWGEISRSSKAKIPQIIGIIHPGSSWTAPGLFVVVPDSEDARNELDRLNLEYEETSGSDACHEFVMRSWIRPMRINRRIVERDESILSDPWLEAGRFRAIRHRGAGDWTSGFHFPTKEGWEEIRKLIDPPPAKDSRPQIQIYRHVASGIVVAERDGDDPPLLEHEVAEEASKCVALRAHLDARARKHLPAASYERLRAAERNEISPWRSYPKTE